MDLHAKILATLWILAVVLIGAQVFCTWACRRELDKEGWAQSNAVYFFTNLGEELLRWPSRILAIVAILDAVVYGLMWVWR